MASNDVHQQDMGLTLTRILAVLARVRTDREQKSIGFELVMLVRLGMTFNTLSKLMSCGLKLW